MFFLTILRDYISWHYTTALVSFVRIYKNFWWFIVQFFSLPQLTASLFSPYKQMTESGGSLFNIESWVAFIVINLMSRLIGLVVRLFIIICGLFCLGLFLLFSTISYGMWLAGPILVIYCLIYGLYLLF